jgi:hypothetical protein
MIRCCRLGSEWNGPLTVTGANPDFEKMSRMTNACRAGTTVNRAPHREGTSAGLTFPEVGALC